jgi:hypothetical protein
MKRFSQRFIGGEFSGLEFETGNRGILPLVRPQVRIRESYTESPLERETSLFIASGIGATAFLGRHDAVILSID